MRVRFWGTRGSIATPGPTTLRYGGNTACVEVRADDGTLIVLDCGTGARALGQALLAERGGTTCGHLLITHTHWDHIQGFPFFAPLFVPGNEWDIYAPGVTGRHLEDTLSGQMEYTYFPVRLDQLGATIRYHDVVEGTFRIGGVKVTSHYLNHPALTLGYRLEAGGASLVYATDHEPHSHHKLELPSGNGKVVLSQPLHHEDRRHVLFMAGADLVIHDAQFTASEDASHIGWGHTAAEQVVDFALAAGAERLALFHHDPNHDDDAIDRTVEACQRRAERETDDEDRILEVTAAAEGQSIDLSEDSKFLLRRQEAEWEVSAAPEGPAVAFKPEDAARTARLGSVPATRDRQVMGPEPEPETVLIVDTPDSVQRLALQLEPEGLRILTAESAEAVLQAARGDEPDLILLGSGVSDVDPLQLSRDLRAAGHNVPVVLLTKPVEAEEAAASFAAGVTDHLIQPYTPAQVRSRVRRWLQRQKMTARAAAHAGVPAAAR
ncbi:MAG TPA: MBL fold metallo-hydrolase [Chloroflexota bacterium]|nr:MBL fold metallo-hydrolase [Chloroflexota bacterium]